MHTQVAGVGMGVTGQEEAALRAPYIEIIDSFLDLIYLVGCRGRGAGNSLKGWHNCSARRRKVRLKGTLR